MAETSSDMVASLDLKDDASCNLKIDAPAQHQKLGSSTLAEHVICMIENRASIVGLAIYNCRSG